METTTIMFCSHNMRNVIDDTLVYNAISIQMLSHCDLIMCVAFGGASMCNGKTVSLKTVYRLSMQSVTNKPKLLCLIVLLGKDTKSSIFTIQYFIR